MASAKNIMLGHSILRGAVSILGFLVLWEIGSRSRQWLGADLFTPVREALGAMGFKTNYLPWIGAVPAPTEVLTSGSSSSISGFSSCCLISNAWRRATVSSERVTSAPRSAASSAVR